MCQIWLENGVSRKWPAAAQLLRSDVQRRRADSVASFDRQEQDLDRTISDYQRMLGSDHVRVEDSRQTKTRKAKDSGYGGITEFILNLLAAESLEPKEIAKRIEAAKIEIRGKSYVESVRNALKRLYKEGRVVRTSGGRYSEKK